MKKRKHKLSNSAFLILVIAAFVLLGQISGIRLCAVISGSMEPNLPIWCLCVVSTKTPYDSIQTGDIVVYYRHSDHMRIIHRVIEIEPDGMVTKGDANPVSDGLSVGRDNLYGKSLFHIPYLGYCIKVAQEPMVRAVIFVCLAAILVMDIVDMRKSGKDPWAETDKDQ